jgi:hypothetical protein
VRRDLGSVVAVVAACGLGLLAPSPATAQAPEATEATESPGPAQVATAISSSGWYADGGAVGDREQLADVASRLSSQGSPIGFALLAAEPPGSSTAYAEQVLDALGTAYTSAGIYVPNDIETVVVLSPTDVGVVSDRWDDAAIDEALDATIEDLRADPTDGLEALAGALARHSPSGSSDADGAGDPHGGGTGWGLGWVVLIVLAIAAFSLMSRLIGGAAHQGGEGEPDNGWSGHSGSDWRTRQRRRSVGSSLFGRSRSSSGSRRSSSGGSRRSSSGGSRRGRGGRRL